MTTTTITIRSRWDGEQVLHEVEADSLRDAVINIVAGGANLRSADLGYADLGGANLGGANLGCADLGGADLRGADLRGADLGYADLRSANLGGADLRSADLGCANLGGADLGCANLGGANLGGANLGGANLRGAKNAPLILFGLRWTVYINGLGSMQIGCQEHAVERWQTFTDRQIAAMDFEALTFWHQHKVMLLAMATNYRHSDDTTVQKGGDA
jgi:hypothetical protein